MLTLLSKLDSFTKYIFFIYFIFMAIWPFGHGSVSKILERKDVFMSSSAVCRRSGLFNTSICRRSGSFNTSIKL